MKKHKIGEPTEYDTVQGINAQFLKIDNLEYFPEKVLINIFTNVNDTDLLNLSDTSCRFENIAKFIFKDKYADEYFVIDDDDQRETCEQLFGRFGRYADMKAIRVEGINKIITETHWIVQLLRQYTNNLRKLSFINCTFEKIRKILSEHIHIEHLILQWVSNDAYFILPNYRNLKKLELKYVEEYTDVANLTKIIRNNPALASLILVICPDFSYHDPMKAIAEHLKHLKELRLHFPLQPQLSNDYIMDSLKNLQILKLTVTDNDLELIRGLGVACKRLKYLAMECYRDDDFYEFNDDMFLAFCRFTTIEQLAIKQFQYDDRIESVVEHLPKLRRLHLCMRILNSSAFILSLLRKCPSIEIITISNCYYIEARTFVNAQFWNEFTEAMQQPNGKLKIAGIGCVTREEIVWDNMVMYSIRHDWKFNETNVNLLDLAAAPVEPLAVGGKQHSPFDQVLDYLDLASLYSLSKVCKQTKRLVESYVEQHAQQNRTFTISDQFHYDAYGLDAFAKHVENLNAIISNDDFTTYLKTIESHYSKLIKLTIYSDVAGIWSNESECIFPQVRHLTVNAYHLHLCSILKKYPKLESLEINSEVLYVHNCCFTPMTIGNLKKFTFEYGVDGDDPAIRLLEKVRKIFENTSTKLIPILREN